MTDKNKKLMMPNSFLFIISDTKYPVNMSILDNVCKYTERKKFSKLFTSMVFVYKSVSLKRFCIEQLCPSIDSMISPFFCTLRHYVIVNLNVNENHVQYVHSKTDEPPRVTQYTV